MSTPNNRKVTVVIPRASDKAVLKKLADRNGVTVSQFIWTRIAALVERARDGGE